MRVYLHVRGHARQVVPAGKDLGAAQGLFCAEVLTVEVALLEDVGITQAKGAYAKARQKNGNVAAKDAAACVEHPAFKQACHFPEVEHTSIAVAPLRADVVPAQKDREVVVLAVFFGQVVVHGNSQGQAVAGAGVGVSPPSLAKMLVDLFAGIKHLKCPAPQYACHIPSNFCP